MKQSDIDHGQGAVDAMQSAFAGRDWAMGDLEPGTNETGALWLAMTGEHDNYETVVPDVNNLYNAMGTTRMKVFKNMILADRGPDGQIQDRDVARTLIMADPIAYRVVLEQQRAALAARKIMEGSDVKAMLAIDPTFTRRERWQKPKGYTDYQWFLTRQTERYLDDNFREAESYDDLNEEGQAIYREAMGRMAPHLTVLNPNSNLDWINHDDQKDLRKTLRELIGEEDLGKKADEATRREEEKVPESPEVIALVSYLRQSPEPRIVDTNDVLTYEQAVRIGGIITAAGTDVENGWTIINAPGDGEDLTDDCTFRRTGRKCFTGATKRLLDVRNEEIGGSTEQADDHLNPIGKLHKEVNKYKRRKEEDFAEREEQVKRFKKGSDALGVVVDKEDARIAALQAISRARVSIEDMGTVASDDLTAQGILQVYVKNQSKAVDNLDTATIESRAKRRLYRREFKTEIADDHEPNNLFMKLERDPPEVNSGGKNDTDLSDQITIVRQGMVSVEDAADALHQRYQTDDKAVKDEKKLWKELMADDRNFDDEMESELRDTDIALKRDGSRWVLEDEKGNKYRSFKDMTASHKVASDGVSKAKQASDTRRLDTSKLISPTEVLRRLYITDPVLENQVRPKKERAFRAMASALMLTNMARNERVYNNRMNRLAEYARQGGKVRQAAGAFVDEAWRGGTEVTFTEYKQEHILTDERFKNFKDIKVNSSIAELATKVTKKEDRENLKALIEEHIRPLAEGSIQGSTLRLTDKAGGFMDPTLLLEATEAVYYTALVREKVGRGRVDKPEILVEVLKEDLDDAPATVTGRTVKTRAQVQRALQEEETAAKAESGDDGPGLLESVWKAKSLGLAARSILGALGGGDKKKKKK